MSESLLHGEIDRLTNELHQTKLLLEAAVMLLDKRTSERDIAIKALKEVRESLRS